MNAGSLVRPTVHLLCGLPAAGETTLARELEQQLPAVRFTLDEWMLALYGLSFDAPDYGHYAARATDLIWDTARQVLAAGVSVVLDWSQWKRSARKLWAQRASDAGYPVVLHWVNVTPDVAISQARLRADQKTPGAHHLGPTDVEHMVPLFEEPSDDEGLVLDVVRP